MRENFSLAAGDFKGGNFIYLELEVVTSMGSEAYLEDSIPP